MPATPGGTRAARTDPALRDSLVERALFCSTPALQQLQFGKSRDFAAWKGLERERAPDRSGPGILCPGQTPSTAEFPQRPWRETTGAYLSCKTCAGSRVIHETPFFANRHNLTVFGLSQQRLIVFGGDGVSLFGQAGFGNSDNPPVSVFQMLGLLGVSQHIWQV